MDDSPERKTRLPPPPRDDDNNNGTKEPGVRVVSVLSMLSDQLNRQRIKKQAYKHEYKRAHRLALELLSGMRSLKARLMINKDCVICYQALGILNGAETHICGHCLHGMHTACGVKWAAQTPKCPVCNEAMILGEI